MDYSINCIRRTGKPLKEKSWDCLFTFLHQNEFQMSKDLNVKTGKTKIPYGCLNKTSLLLWLKHQMSVWSKAMAVGMWKERKARLVGEGEAIKRWCYWQGWWLTGCKTVWKVGRSSKKKKSDFFTLRICWRHTEVFIACRQIPLPFPKPDPDGMFTKHPDLK